MRYVLGISFYNKITKELSEGIAIVDKYGTYPNIGRISSIQEAIDEGKEINTIVYDDLDSIKKVISDYSIRFRRDDVAKPHQIWQKSKRTIRFYPIKVDSSKFEFKIGEKIPMRKQPMGQEKTSVYKLLAR